MYQNRKSLDNTMIIKALILVLVAETGLEPVTFGL